MEESIWMKVMHLQSSPKELPWVLTITLPLGKGLVFWGGIRHSLWLNHTHIPQSPCCNQKGKVHKTDRKSTPERPHLYAVIKQHFQVLNALLSSDCSPISYPCLDHVGSQAGNHDLIWQILTDASRGLLPARHPSIRPDLSECAW